MRRVLIFVITAAIAFVTPACSRRAQSKKADNAAQTNIDACTLLSKKEIEIVQTSPIKGTKSSEQAGGDFRVAQCFYAAAEFTKSVNLAVIQKHPTDARKRTPRQFWQETFSGTGERNEKGEKERRTPPKKISGVGDDAYWVPNRFGGTLYVLKGEAFISVSVGGTDPEQAKIDKCKALAQKAISRM
jgi:hypothetical protein